MLMKIIWFSARIQAEHIIFYKRHKLIKGSWEAILPCYGQLEF